MKKNYITPSTVAATWASMGLMADPVIGMSTGSATTGTAYTDDSSFID